MDRFFSKLDLRDIKIDPRGNRFPPDAAAYEAEDSEIDPAVEDAPRNGVHPSHPDVAAYGGPAAEPSWPARAVTVSEAVVSEADIQSEVISEEEAGATPRRAMADDSFALPEMNGDVLKVSARSRPSAVAGAIAGVVREAGRAEVQAIGAGATNQAIKAVAIARDYLRETGIEAICLPAFIDITIDNEDRTAIRLVIEPR